MIVNCLRANQVSSLAAKFVIALIMVAVSIGLPQPSTAQTALDDYVAAPDATYGFSLDSTVSGAGYTGYNIDLTSQTWRDPSEITNRTLWEHKMTIAQPDTIFGNTAILLINGGSNPGNFELLNDYALLTGSVVVNLPAIPNQPLQFAGEAFTRTEDEIIAKTFANFLDGGDSEWPLLLPMVKSAVRAMDTTQTHMASQGVTIDNFFIIGGSKRGWTTWLTAAVDDRVSAIVPGVIDMLNMDESMAHHRDAYVGTTVGLIDGYSLAVGDYVLENVMDRLDTPRGQELLAIVDPYEYRDRLDMPKYLVNSTGDQFFVPDSSQFYYEDLIGPKYLRYVPNTDHSLNEEAIAGSLVFYNALAQGLSLPDFSWNVSPDGTSITVNTVDTPLSVLVWEATNPVNRDFRAATFGTNWSSSPLAEQGPGEYMASVSTPPTGATAFMVEMTYLVGGLPLTFTTEVSVVQIPEPASCVQFILGTAFASLGFCRTRRSQVSVPE